MGEMPSILLTCQSSTYGGVERRLLHEAIVLRSMGFEVWLAPSRFRGDETWLRAMSESGVRLLRWSPYKFIERQHTFFPAAHLGMFGRYRIRKHAFSLAHVALPWTRVGMTRVFHLSQAGSSGGLGSALHLSQGDMATRTQTHISCARCAVLKRPMQSPCPFAIAFWLISRAVPNTSRLT